MLPTVMEPAKIAHQPANRDAARAKATARRLRGAASVAVVMDLRRVCVMAVVVRAVVLPVLM